jgi:hypothetical protein
MFSRETTAVPRAAALSSTKSQLKPPVPFANSKTPNFTAVPSLSARIVNKEEVTTEVEEDTIAEVEVEVDTRIATTTPTCRVLPLRRDANSLLGISPGRLVGVNSKITSVSVVRLTVPRLLKAVMVARGALVLLGSTLLRMRRRPFLSSMELSSWVGPWMSGLTTRLNFILAARNLNMTKLFEICSSQVQVSAFRLFQRIIWMGRIMLVYCPGIEFQALGQIESIFHCAMDTPYSFMT